VSIFENTKRVKFEVIVVDNGSTDGSKEAIKDLEYSVRVIEPGENIGFARGCNLGAEHSVGNYILFLNPDTILKGDVVTGMFEWLDGKVEYGAVGCKLLNDDGTIQYTCASRLPQPKEELFTQLMLNKVFPQSAILSSREMEYWDHKNSRDIECLSGACIMLPRSIFDNIGGFDAQFFMYGEDVDLCYQIKKIGFKLFYLADEEVVHFGGKSVENVLMNNFSALKQRESNHKYMVKNFGHQKGAYYKLSVLFGCLVRLLILVITYPATLVLGRKRRQQYASHIKRCLALIKWSVSCSRHS
jgi:GT2 family glycosyltransferase